MKKLYNVMRYVTQVGDVFKRGLAFVNVFKKKSCGASLCKSEEKYIVGEIYEFNGTRYIYSGNGINGWPVWQNEKNYIAGHKEAFPIIS